MYHDLLLIGIFVLIPLGTNHSVHRQDLLDLRCVKYSVVPRKVVTSLSWCLVRGRDAGRGSFN